MKSKRQILSRFVKKFREQFSFISDALYAYNFSYKPILFIILIVFNYRTVSSSVWPLWKLHSTPFLPWGTIYAFLKVDYLTIDNIKFSGWKFKPECQYKWSNCFKNIRLLSTYICIQRTLGNYSCDHHRARKCRVTTRHCPTQIIWDKYVRIGQFTWPGKVNLIEL